MMLGMGVAVKDLWEITFGKPAVDPEHLTKALENEVTKDDLDFRTQLLIRDSIDALADYWGSARVDSWLGQSPCGAQLRSVWKSDLGPAGFPTLRRRVMTTLHPETVLEFLRILGSRLSQPTQIVVGGSVALILSDELIRQTDDVDVVDEVPAEIRSHHALVDELMQQFGLRITHFQSHYLPNGWRDRIHSLGRYGKLDVFLVDSVDVFVSKLFSARMKDLGDLRHLARRLDKRKIESRIISCARGLRENAQLAKNAETNWYVLYGEPLPAGEASA
jgi:uncharacterized nucleotidyltransferase DUF6036